MSLVLNDIFKINIDATNKSNQEVEAEIRNQLSSAGINNVNISFEMTPDGERQIKIKIPEESIPEDGGVEMTIKDGKRVNKFKEVKKHSPGGDNENFSTMTDAEIKLWKQLCFQILKGLRLAQWKVKLLYCLMNPILKR